MASRNAVSNIQSNMREIEKLMEDVLQGLSKNSSYSHLNERDRKFAKDESLNYLEVTTDQLLKKLKNYQTFLNRKQQ